MNESNIIVTPENIISTFGLVMDHTLEYEMNQSNGSFQIASKFSIKQKNQPDECFFTDNYEDCVNPCILALVKTNLNKDGSFTPVINFNNQTMDTLLKVSNRYIEVYKLMYGIKEFHKRDKVDLFFIANYGFTDELLMTSLHCSKIKLLEYVDDCHGPVETNVHYFVNDFIKIFDMECIDENTDMEKLYPLIEMQRTINDMERI